MSTLPIANEDLLMRLPLLPAQIYRRAPNAKTAQERHLAAFFLWKAGMKLLGSAGIVEIARLGQPTDQLRECLYNLSWPPFQTQPIGLAFSPDGRWLASGSGDHTLFLRDPEVISGEKNWDDA